MFGFKDTGATVQQYTCGKAIWQTATAPAIPDMQNTQVTNWNYCECFDQGLTYNTDFDTAAQSSFCIALGIIAASPD